MGFDFPPNSESRKKLLQGLTKDNALGWESDPESLVSSGLANSHGGGGFGVMRLGRDSFLEAQYSTVSGWVATGAPLRAARAGAPGARCARIENGPRRRKPWATVFPFTSYMFLFSFSFRIR